jgi:hypothetical protein
MKELNFRKCLNCGSLKTAELEVLARVYSGGL